MCEIENLSIHQSERVRNDTLLALPSQSFPYTLMVSVLSPMFEGFESLWTECVGVNHLPLECVLLTNSYTIEGRITRTRGKLPLRMRRAIRPSMLRNISYLYNGSQVNPIGCQAVFLNGIPFPYWTRTSRHSKEQRRPTSLYAC